MSAFDTFATAVRARPPRLAVVLGSGLGAVPHRFTELASVSFADVPGLVAPSVHGHSGRMSLGLCDGRPVLVCRGRLHFYEGHPWDRVAGLVRATADLGAQVLLLTNAAGGIHDSLWPGDLMVLSGHLFLQTPDRVRGNRIENPYSARLIEMMRDIERANGRPLPAG